VSLSNFEVRPGGSVGCWLNSAPVCRPDFWSNKSESLILIHSWSESVRCSVVQGSNTTVPTVSSGTSNNRGSYPSSQSTKWSVQGEADYSRAPWRGLFASAIVIKVIACSRQEEARGIQPEPPRGGSSHSPYSWSFLLSFVRFTGICLCHSTSWLVCARSAQLVQILPLNNPYKLTGCERTTGIILTRELYPWKSQEHALLEVMGRHN